MEPELFEQTQWAKANIRDNLSYTGLAAGLSPPVWPNVDIYVAKFLSLLAIK